MIKNTKLFIHENAFENAVYEMGAIFSRGRFVKEDQQATAERVSQGQTCYKKFIHNINNRAPWLSLLGLPSLSQVTSTHLKIRHQ